MNCLVSAYKLAFDAINIFLQISYLISFSAIYSFLQIGTKFYMTEIVDKNNVFFRYSLP